MLRPKAGGELPVLAFNIVDDRRARPGQERGNDEAHAFARSCRGKAQDMLRAVMPQIVTAELAEHDAIRAEESSRLHFVGLRPAGRAVCLDIAGFAGAQHGHEDRDGDGDETAGGGDNRAFIEDRRRIGVVEIPPPEESRRMVDRPAGQLEPRITKLRLEAEPPCCPLCCSPNRHQNDQ